MHIGTQLTASKMPFLCAQLHVFMVMQLPNCECDAPPPVISSQYGLLNACLA